MAQKLGNRQAMCDLTIENPLVICLLDITGYLAKVEMASYLQWLCLQVFDSQKART